MKKKCPNCNDEMEYHDKDCYGFSGRLTKKQHYFCSMCNIEVLSDGSMRLGL